VGVGVQRAGEIVELPQRWPGDEGWEEKAYVAGHTAIGADGKPMRD
jgi:hypothetical protein